MPKPSGETSKRSLVQLDDLLTTRVTEIARALSKEIEEPVREEFQLPLKDWTVMRVLAAHGPLPPNEIHRVGGQNKPQISRALKCLFDRELVAKRPHPEDDRTFLVYLTESGSDMYSSALKKMRKRQTKFLKTLPAGEDKQLQELLNRLGATSER